MGKIVEALEFHGCVSMPDFTIGEYDYVANPFLQEILDEFGIDLDLKDFHDRYFDDIKIGNGDVFLYSNQRNSENLFVVDLFRDIDDQLDSISFGIRCEKTLHPFVRKRVLRFFDSASCQFSLEESSHSQKLRKMIDKGNYPKLIEYPECNRTYLQQLHHIVST
ncbi:hypothetical protein [Inquilinus sp.]|jgi:hypothetical protein|uniref:hypothetical protein n=1 Tax=Inquilinus sp. TaxID=1932117 RepID=UPI003784B308